MTDEAERRVDLSGELRNVRTSLDALSEAIVTSFDEKRITDAIIAEQRRDRHTFLVLVATAVAVVVIAMSIGIGVSRSNHAIVSRIEDCSTKAGRCYEEQQKTAGAAVQAVLDGMKAQIDPHRLRNEAENLCQVEVFAIPPERRGLTIERALDLYNGCVLRRSGGTEPPPLPKNPYSTTTTAGEHP